MSIFRISLSASVIWAVHTTMTAPQPPPLCDEQVGPAGLEVSAMPIFIKSCFWSAGLAEILAILTNLYPSNSLTKYAASLLVRSPSTPDAIRTTWWFIFAWVCTISGAFIRRSCYRNLGEMFTFQVSLRRNHKLVTSGPYSFVRHPSYSSGALALSGALMCHTIPGSWAVECSGIFQPSWAGPLIATCWLIASIMGTLVIAPRLEQEDALLKRRFGSEWDAWARNVPYRLLPGLY
ncbi:hypothetical protein GALMADRAFT_575367 [Galerina marginata CBS 339.88]|uniref:Protein-S-isoprenylcysteine O-methyltransferase n=1 Tax=Galerina marginata (strain CBS 339.88) TaxID=685588 RepID=A0A067T2W9_GALM3|nr:hypothetical protein GALMADRAFT_575367 [Galerina marginata CBS 339.88]